jgi:hypothetical protein
VIRDPSAHTEFVDNQAKYHLVGNQGAGFDGGLSLDACVLLDPAWAQELWVHAPRGVLSRTFLRRRSPELMDDSCGNLCIKRSVCVPFPTPGAPTSMILAALESAIV